ncbi:HIT family protein [Nocardia sp. NPDC055321]
MVGECVFCVRISAGQIEGEYPGGVVRFAPIEPVVAGHMLFVPGWHAEHPDVAAVGRAMESAAAYGRAQGTDFNLITSAGAAATQTVAHLHVHYVPRRAGDGLGLPWTGTSGSG